MIKLKTEYIATPAFVEAVELYSKMLDDYDKELLRQIQEFPARQKELAERKATLDKAGAEELDLAIKKRLSDLKLKIDDEKKLKVPIQSSDEYDLQSLKASQSSVAKERLSVQSLIRDKAKYAEVADQVTRALAEAGKGNAQMAYTLMDQATKNPLVKSDLKLKTKKETYKIAADEAAKSAPKPVVTTPGIPPKGDPAPVVKASEKAAADKAAAVKKEAERRAAAAAAKKSEGSTDAPEEEDNTTTYLLGGVGALVLGAVGFFFLKKRKKNEDDDED
jgi:colicin import membrane protein